MDMSEYQTSNVWHVISAIAKRNVERYTCCAEPFIDLTFWITIRRKATFYAYTLILPCVLLTSLTLILFWIPAESPAKLTLGKVINLWFFTKLKCVCFELKIYQFCKILVEQLEIILKTHTILLYTGIPFLIHETYKSNITVIEIFSFARSFYHISKHCLSQ